MFKKIVITIFATLALMGGVSVATATAAPDSPGTSQRDNTCPICGEKLPDGDKERALHNLQESHWDYLVEDILQRREL